jgi:hypothetical protein
MQSQPIYIGWYRFFIAPEAGPRKGFGRFSADGASRKQLASGSPETAAPTLVCKGGRGLF